MFAFLQLNLSWCNGCASNSVLCPTLRRTKFYCCKAFLFHDIDLCVSTNSHNWITSSYLWGYLSLTLPLKSLLIVHLSFDTYGIIFFYCFQYCLIVIIFKSFTMLWNNEYQNALKKFKFKVLKEEKTREL